MRSLRDFLGSPCPACRTDILQRAPDRARMPGSDNEAWCASCDRVLTVQDLTRLTAKRGGILGRLFGGRPGRTA